MTGNEARGSDPALRYPSIASTNIHKPELDSYSLFVGRRIGMLDDTSDEMNEEARTISREELQTRNAMLFLDF